MLANLLDLGCTFDWITPAIAYIQDFVNGPHSSFAVPATAGWSRRDIRRLLNERGIDVWGLMIDREKLMFTVRRRQARWAYHLLDQQGVPILYAPVEAIEPTAQSKHNRTNASPAPADNRAEPPGNPLESVSNFLDRLHGDQL